MTVSTRIVDLHALSIMLLICDRSMWCCALGGGVFVFTDTYNMNFVKCAFTNNSAAIGKSPA
jgi:hypothetical protein